MFIQRKTRRIFQLMRENSLLLEVIILAIIGLVIACIMTLLLAWKNAERIDLNTISTSSKQSLTQVVKNLDTLTQKHATIIYGMKRDWAAQSFLTITDASTLEAMNATYKLTSLLGSLNFLGEDGFRIPLILTNAQGEIKMTNGYTGMSRDELQTATDSYESIAKGSKGGEISYTFLANGPSSLQRERNCMVMSQALNNTRTGLNYGYLYIIVYQDQLKKSYESLSNPASRLILLDDNGVIVSAEDTSLIGNKFPELLGAVEKAEERNLQFNQASFNGSKVYVVSQADPKWGLHAVSIIDMAATAKYISKSFREMMMICIIAIVFILFVFYLCVEYRFAPLRQLVRHMERAESDDIFTVIPVKGGYEVRQLTRAYNKMTQNISSYIAALLAGEKQKRSLEIRSLRMQIDPHFIYNTLASIKFLILRGDTEKAAKAIDMFTFLLRSNIGTDQEFVTVEQEISNVESYAYLQKIRFGTRIELQIHCEEDARNCMMPKLVLQPFVENAFFHAFSPESDSGYICIFVCIKNDELVCEIIDNGNGFPSEMSRKKSPQKDNESIGIRNVNERLALLYGENYGVSVSSKKGEGSIVTLRIPCQCTLS